MNRTEFTSKLTAGILLAVCFGVALYFRVVLPYDNVFVGDWIKFTGVDAYYFMRLVDNLVHNFPHLISFDPYLLYPGGSAISAQTFWPYFISVVAWLVGLGAPSQHTVDVVGVYFPAILGALTTIPVYFIGKALFNRWAGVIAAGLVAILPGEFLGRSILGFTDYHVAEVFFTTVTMLFLILAVKAGRDKQFTFSSLWHRQWATVTKPLIYSLLAGVFLGIYFLTWAGALLFVLIIFIYFVIQFIIDHLKRRSTEYLCLVSTIVFVVTFLISLPLSPDRLFIASFTIAIIIPIIMGVLSYFMARLNIKPIIYPAAIIGLGLASLAILRFANPALFLTMEGSLQFFAWPLGTTVLEMQPLLFPGGSFSWAIAWGNFTTSLILSVISLGILIYLVIKRGETEITVFVIWSLIMLAATLAMRRFAYYLIINAALLTGYLSWLILEFAGLKKLAAIPTDMPKDIKRKPKLQRRHPSRSMARIGTALGVIAIFFVVFFPNIGRAANQASQPVFAPSDAWCESLAWLQNNTPEPFGNPDYYYELYKEPPAGKSYTSPETAYGVTAWWDYGYWITRIGHRIPTSTPGTGHIGEASILTAQDEASADGILDRWDSRYIIVDNALSNIIGGKFNAVATLSGNSPDKFYGIYYQLNGNTLEPMLLFYPEYYRSLVNHLYYFDGGIVTPTSTIVISYEEKISPDGQPYKQITDRKSFVSYDDAQAYIASQASDNYKIVGYQPRVSPVPLPALEHCKLIYTSNNSVVVPGVGIVPEVKIFEYIR
ncbi:MAG: oligosaccharyl transferase, archaeosortase A system-associated [Dehalococcoidia bacterium]|nr:oligosaccharyl transferase, archaeosortase A system-associated [Dehalococcoidia bacterium]